MRLTKGLRVSKKKRKDHRTRSLTDLEYSYSNHDIWPGDETTVALCIFLYPGWHNIRPLGRSTIHYYY